MEIKTVKQIELNKLIQLQGRKKYLICTSGYEARCSYVAQRYHKKFDERFVFGVDSFAENSQRKFNDEFYASNDFHHYKEPENEGGSLVKVINEILKNNSESLEIYIDYSSMPRTWYSTIINSIESFNYSNSLLLVFIYSEAEFSKPSGDETENLFVEPLKGFSYFDTPDRPTALIIGLGYESRRPLGLREYFDASKVYLFITDEASSGEYHREVLEKNDELISSNPIDDIFYYPVFDQEYTFFELERLCNSLLKDYRVVIAPCGPKYFTLCSLLAAQRNKEINVWRISPGDQRTPIDRVASGNVYCIKIDLN